MEKYKVGDKVKIIDHRGDCWNSEGEMDKYFGKTLTIKAVDFGLYVMKECPKWLWDDNDIFGLVDKKGR